MRFLQPLFCPAGQRSAVARAFSLSDDRIFTHISNRSAYAVLEHPNSKYRRLPRLPGILQRLTAYDYVLEHSSLRWYALTRAKLDLMKQLGVSRPDLPQRTYQSRYDETPATPDTQSVQYFVDHSPIGISPGWRVVFVFVAEPSRPRNLYRHIVGNYGSLFRVLRARGLRVSVVPLTTPGIVFPVSERSRLAALASPPTSLDRRRLFLHVEAQLLRRALRDKDLSIISTYGGADAVERHLAATRVKLVDLRGVGNVPTDVFFWSTDRLRTPQWARKLGAVGAPAPAGGALMMGFLDMSPWRRAFWSIPGDAFHRPAVAGAAGASRGAPVAGHRARAGARSLYPLGLGRPHRARRPVLLLVAGLRFGLQPVVPQPRRQAQPRQASAVAARGPRQGPGAGHRREAPSDRDARGSSSAVVRDAREGALHRTGHLRRDRHRQDVELHVSVRAPALQLAARRYGEARRRADSRGEGGLLLRGPEDDEGARPLWQMAYTNCVRWIIQSYRVFPDPWFTFHDIYNCMVDKKALLEQVNAATEHVYGKYVYVLQMSRADFNQHREDLLTLQLSPPGVDPDNPPEDEDIKTEPFKIAPPEANVTDKDTPAWSDLHERVGVLLGDRPFKELKRVLARLDLGYCCHEVQAPSQAELDLDKKITQWYSMNWLGLDEKLRSSIVEGLSVFLGVFVVPEVARVFCPPRPDSQTPEELKTMMPALADCIESGKILALNMPAGENPSLARAVGVILKGSWLGALLLRPKLMKEDEERLEEGQRARRGGSSPVTSVRPCSCATSTRCSRRAARRTRSGDEKAFALTRQSKCIPIVATQSIVSLKSVIGDGETWQSLLQTLRSRIFLSLADNFSLEMASKLLGQVTRTRASYSLSENTAQAGASVFTGRVGGGGKASAGVSKSFQEKREPLFHPRDLNLLGTSQAIAQIFDGRTMRDAHRVYLKPYYLDRDKPYWRQVEEGLL